jgi:hypothetical protein
VQNRNLTLKRHYCGRSLRRGGEQLS